MKKILLALVVIAAFTVVSCKGDTKTNTSTVKDTTLAMANFGVRGNCGMCKATIEKAAKSVEGVAEATWDVKNKSIAVSYDKDKSNLSEIHKAISKAGYDTEQAIGNNDAYQNLPQCCLYDRNQPMNQ